MRLQHIDPLRASLLLALALAGCRSSPERKDIRHEWHTTLQELGVQPIYPPREDVQAGDIYLRRAMDESMWEPNLSLPLDLWLAQVDLRETASSFYATRSRFADSPGTKEAAYLAREDAPVAADDQRLMQVAFPEFSSMTVRGQDLEWLVPVEALAIAGGTSWRGGHEISLRIPSVESYGLPTQNVLDHVVVEEEGKLRLSPNLGLSGARLQALWEEQKKRIQADGWLIEDGDRSLCLEVIREVYFARAIDICISRSAGGNAEISVIAPAGATGGSDTDFVELLNASLTRTLEQSAPRATVRVIAANDAAVVLRRTFQRPIAVGFRSFVLSVDPSTGIVAGIGAVPYDLPDQAAQPRKTRLEPALSRELSKWFQNEAESVTAAYDGESWVLRVATKAGEGGGASYLFLTQADREEIAGKLRKTLGRLDDESADQLEAFVDGAVEFVEK